jgi:hypothetical protein
MHHLLRAEAVLEHLVRGLERRRGVAAPQVEVEREVGVLLALEVLQVGERAGGLQLVVHHRLRGHRLDLVVYRRHRLVLGDDEVRGLLRHVRIGGEHDGHRLADVAHLVDGEDRLVVEGRPEMQVRNDLQQVGGHHDAVHAADGLRGGHVDALDAAMRHRAAEYLAVQHSRQLEVVHVLGAAGDLEPGLEPRDRAADLAGLSGLGALHRSSSGYRPA